METICASVEASQFRRADAVHARVDPVVLL